MIWREERGRDPGKNVNTVALPSSFCDPLWRFSYSLAAAGVEHKALGEEEAEAGHDCLANGERKDGGEEGRERREERGGEG